MQTARVNNNKIAIVGSGTLALAVARELRALGLGVALTQNLSGPTPSFLGVVEATGGMAPAFDCAMTALGKGLPVISASPLLAGVHGQVMLTAARAQNLGLGLSGALLGGLPIPQNGSEMILLSDGAASEALSRLADRGQSVESSRAAMLAKHQDVSDLAGKITLTRALALHGLWSGHKWMSPAAATRMDVAHLSATRAAEVRRAGYTWRFGAVIQPEQVYVGPLALGASESLAQRDTIGLTLQSSAVTMEIAQSEGERALDGILHDVQLLLANQLNAPLQLPAKKQGASLVQEWLPLAQGSEGALSIPALGTAAQTPLRAAA
jgi:hypothetical protein